MSLPKNLKYGSKVESAACRSFRSNLAPQNGTNGYNLNDTIIFNIPTNTGLFLNSQDSYLKFNATVTSGANNNICRLGVAGAHGFIQRVRIYHNSSLLEDTDNYNELATMLFDLQVSTSSSYGKMNAQGVGTRADMIMTNNAVVAADAADLGTAVTLANALKVASNATSLSVFKANNGESLGTLANAGTVTNTYCLNLISMIGTLCQNNYLPLIMQNSPLRVEVQLVDSALKAFAQSAAVTSLTLNNVEFIANYLQLGDQAMSSVYSSLQGAPLQFVLPQYRNYQYSYALAQAAQTSVAMPIPSKFSSLRSLFITIRETTGALGFFPCSSVTRGIIDYVFRIGPELLPAKAVSTTAEMFCEVVKAIGGMSDLNYAPAIDKASYNLGLSVANNAAGSSSAGSFYIGIDLEEFSGASKETIFCGKNTNNSDVFCLMNFAAQAGGAITARFDAYALIDAVFVIENGNAYIKF